MRKQRRTTLGKKFSKYCVNVLKMYNMGNVSVPRLFY